MTTEPCPMCGSSHDRELYAQPFRIVRCLECGLVRRDPIPSASDLIEVYRRDEYFRLGRAKGIGYGDYYADAPVYRPYFRAKIRLLARYSTPPGDLLEIGAAAGYALEAARSAGWNVRGLELSSAAVRYAVEDLGLDVVEGSFNEVDEHEAFDVVLCFQTLEHVHGVRAAVRTMVEALRPGGVLMLTTPDHDSWVRRTLRRWWSSYRPEHLVYFDRARLTKLLVESGLDVRAVEADGPLWAPLRRIAERAAHLYGLAVLRRLPLPGWRVPVWLGDMVVIAVKRASGPRS